MARRRMEWGHDFYLKFLELYCPGLSPDTAKKSVKKFFFTDFFYFPAWEAASLIIWSVTELKSTGVSSAFTSLNPTPSLPV